MWAIFVALFGGIYWAYRIGSDRAAFKRAKFELDIKKSYWEDWARKVVDSNIESQIDSDIINPETFQKLKDDAIELIRSFHGLQHADFNNYYNSKYHDYYVRKMAAYIALVKNGKLPMLQYREVPNYLELSIDIKPSKRSRIEFAKWIEQTMRDNGVPHATLYYTGVDYASFTWAPYVIESDKAISLGDPSLETRMLGVSTEETDSRNNVIIKRKITNKERV